MSIILHLALAMLIALGSTKGLIHLLENHRNLPRMTMLLAQINGGPTSDAFVPPVCMQIGPLHCARNQTVPLRTVTCVKDMYPLRYTSYTEECCHVLEEPQEYPADLYLVQLVRLNCRATRSFKHLPSMRTIHHTQLLRIQSKHMSRLLKQT